MWIKELIVLTDERNGERGSRNGVGDHEQEDSERQQDGDAERDLLSGVGRQAEADHDEHGQHDARQDDVHHVELIAPFEMKREDNVRVAVRFLLATVPFTVHQRHQHLQKLYLRLEWHVCCRFNVVDLINAVTLR